MFRSADRVYLISEGKVVTHGTPHELVHDQKAIDAYLGRSFEEDGFTRQFASRLHPGHTEEMPVAEPVRESVATATLPERPTAFPTTTPAPFATLSGPVGTLLEAEKLHRWVEQLVDDLKMKAATVELVSRGRAAVPVLLEALERRETVLRRRAFEVLKYVAREHLPFDYDPDAPDEQRLRQAAYLRAKIERRK